MSNTIVAVQQLWGIQNATSKEGVRSNGLFWVQTSDKQNFVFHYTRFADTNPNVDCFFLISEGVTDEQAKNVLGKVSDKEIEILKKVYTRAMNSPQFKTLEEGVDCLLPIDEKTYSYKVYKVGNINTVGLHLQKIEDAN